MRKCPFCNAEVEFRTPYLIYLEKTDTWTFMHHCNDSLSIFITGKTVEDVIAEWNGEHEEQTSESL